MKALRYYILVSFFLSFFASSLSQASENDEEFNVDLMIPEAAKLEIHHEGFKELSQLALLEINQHMGQASIPDLELKVLPLLRIKIAKMIAIPQIKGLQISPFEGGLKISLQLKKLDLNIGLIQIENYFMPTFATKCYDTNIFLGDEQPIPIDAQIGIALSDSSVALKLASFDLNLQKDQYRQTGPAACESSFGRKAPITQALTAAILAGARKRLIKSLEKQLEDYLPKLAAKLNAFTAVSLPLTTPDFLIFPASYFSIGFVPQKLKISDSGLAFELGLHIAGGEPLSQNFPNPNKEAVNAAKPSMLASAVLGINPVVINTLFAILFRKGSREFELSPALHSVFTHLLSIQELEEFWPELKGAMAEEPHLRLYVSIQEPPRLSIAGDKQALLVQSGNIKLRLQIRKNKRWQDFYYLTMQLGLVADPSVQDGQFCMPLSAPKVSLQGDWAPNYQAQDRAFDEDLAADTLQEALALAFAAYTKAPFTLPPLTIQNRPLQLTLFGIERPYLTLGFRFFP